MSGVPVGPIAQELGKTFQLKGVLGRGGMGVVYHAWDLQSGRDVAVKVVLGAEPDSRSRERFRREGELTARLNHPGIVRVHGAGEVCGRPYLTYELVEGCRTLDEVFQEVDLRRRVELLRDAARALGYAHREGVVHRDVKPDNMLVDRDGRVRVADFGLGLDKDLDPLTRTGGVVGTLGYISPEQLGALRDLVGPATDVWSLGVILHEALTGERLFDGESLFEVVAKVTKGTVPRPRSLDPTAPRALEAICMRALRQEPAERYTDAEELAADLDRYLAGDDVLAPLSSRAWALPLAVAFLVVAVGGVVLLASAPSPPPSPAAPPKRVRAAAPQPAPPAPPRQRDAGRGEIPTEPALATLAHKAAAGDVDAARDLGWVYHYGSRWHGVEPDRVRARGWYRRAALAGDTRAMSRLGTLLAREFDDAEGFLRWKERAAGASGPVAEAAARELAVYHARREGGLNEGLGLFRECVERGYAIEDTWLRFAVSRWPTFADMTNYLFWGKGGGAPVKLSGSDPLEGLLLLHEGDLRVAHAQGDPDQLHLARREYGRGFDRGVAACRGRELRVSVSTKDEALIARHTRKLESLAKKGAPGGTYELAIYLLDREQPNQARGLELLEKVAGKYSQAGYRLGLELRDAESPDFEGAAKHLRLASARGQPGAAFALGTLLLSGLAKEVELDEAERAFRLALERGEAGDALTLFLKVGEAPETAISWIVTDQEALANAGQVESMMRVAANYHQGRGVGLDLIKAIRWYARAVDAGKISALIRLGYIIERRLLDSAIHLACLRQLIALTGGQGAGAHTAEARIASIYAGRYWAGERAALGRWAEYAERSALGGDLLGAARWGEVLAARGEYERAAEQFRAGSSGPTRVSEALLGMGRLVWKGLLGEPPNREAGLEWLRRAEALTGGPLAAAITRGQLYRDDEMNAEAEAAFRQAGELGWAESWLDAGRVATTPEAAAMYFARAPMDEARFELGRLLHSGALGEARVGEGGSILDGLARAGNELARAYLDEAAR